MSHSTPNIKNEIIQIKLEPWVYAILADPVTKQPVTPDHFVDRNGVLDARIYLKNTHNYSNWEEGQEEYEAHTLAAHDSSPKLSLDKYKAEIEGDRPIYTHFRLDGRILDNGGQMGTVREFLSSEVEFVSTDPWLEAPLGSSVSRQQAYACLRQPLNFIAATSEFLPFLNESFDWVHMRSMLDHVQVPDLCLLEARRVLRPGGRILIGLYVRGGKAGVIPFNRRLKNWIKDGLGIVGINRWKDSHVWHPTYKELLTLITDNGFTVQDTYWQPGLNDFVCYICARKAY